MTVVISDHDLYAPASAEHACTICGRQPLGFPFLWWMPASEKGSDIHICSRCCAHIRQGMTADLIHIAAIIEMQAANPAYSTLTLQRRSLRDLKADSEREKREEEDRMRWFQQGWDAREAESAKAQPVAGNTAETKH